MQATLKALPLAKAAAIQPEFDFRDIRGTLVGIWAPQFASALNVVGYLLTRKGAHNSHTCAVEIRVHRDLTGVLLMGEFSCIEQSTACGFVSVEHLPPSARLPTGRPTLS
jgi:alpha-acetolactate decarboxylase